jgi:hypothetical protein
MGCKGSKVQILSLRPFFISITVKILLKWLYIKKFKKPFSIKSGFFSLN